MKLGLILECQPDGPDEKVLRCLLSHSETEVETEMASQGNKINLFAQCGAAARQLLDDGCEHIVIVWDLHPADWGDELARQERAPCLHQDREKIFASLTTAGVRHASVSLVAIEFMLESWLLADKQAIADFLSKELGTRIRKQQVGNHNPAQCSKPKDVLSKIFEQCRYRRYMDFSHAHKIASEVKNLNELKKCPTFQRFWDKATRQP